MILGHVFNHLQNYSITINFIIDLKSNPKSIFGFVVDAIDKVYLIFLVFQDVSPFFFPSVELELVIQIMIPLHICRSS
jgi:hypothetical protein